MRINRCVKWKRIASAMNIYSAKQPQMKYRPVARLKQLGVCVEGGGGGEVWGGEGEQIGGTKLPLSPVTRKKKPIWELRVILRCNLRT